MAILASAAASSAAAQFSYPDFSSVAGLAFNAAAAQAGAVLRVVPATSGARGSVWYDQLVPVQDGFDTAFQFRITQPGGTTQPPYGGGADGMTFTVQNDPRGITAIGGAGHRLGYGGSAGTAIANSLVIEIDTWFNSSLNDPNANHISVHTRGAIANSEHEDFSLGRVTPTTDMSGGQVHTLRIRYTPGQLEVYLDDLLVPVLSIAYDVVTGGTLLNNSSVGGLGLANGQAYVGFTAATGSAYNNHDVLSWEWGYPSLGQSYCTPAIPNSTGFPGTITAMGSSLVVNNNVTLAADQLPPSQFAYFLASQMQGLVNPPGSNGLLCLGGSIGRYNQPQNIIVGPTGSIQIDLTAVPQPTGFVVVQPGDTWNFQCWYRELGSSNNFTDAVSVTFQ